MGIDIGCCLIVGLPADDLRELLDEDEAMYDFVNRNEFDASSPWYDSGVSNGIIGYMINNTDNFDELDFLKLGHDTMHAILKFENLTGMTPKLYLSNHGT